MVNKRQAVFAEVFVKNAGLKSHNSIDSSPQSSVFQRSSDNDFLFSYLPTKRDLDESKGKNATNRGNTCPIPATCFNKHQFVRP